MREAMAIGVPTISSVCGSALDYVENGQSGLLYRYEEYEVLAMQIKRVLLNEELSKKLSENGRKAHEKLFDGRELPLKEIYQMCVEKSFEEEVL
jgi:glycosyltransferase involved in cell wall biosynthesis